MDGGDGEEIKVPAGRGFAQINADKACGFGFISHLIRIFRVHLHPVVFILFVLAAFASASDDKRYDVPIGDSPSYGPVDAPVTIIEFIDFQ